MIGSILHDFLHLFATVIWIGGMFFFNFVLMPSLGAIDPPHRGKLLEVVGKRFSIMAWSSIIILLITGFIMTPSGMLFYISTTYGLALTLKHILFLVMIVIGFLISIVIAPKMKGLSPKPGEPPSPGFIHIQKQMEVLAIVNMILGVLVLLCVVIT